MQMSPQTQCKMFDSSMLLNLVSSCTMLLSNLLCRFDVEDAKPILYVYELQLMPAQQRKGLGAFLMTLLKLVAKKNQLDAIMLTVMNVSVHAMQFHIIALDAEN